jgi:hypothetical protein
MGYAAFHALFERADTDDTLWWLRVARGFLLDPQEAKDFRRQRLELMRDHLDMSMALLDPDRAAPRARIAVDDGGG